MTAVLLLALSSGAPADSDCTLQIHDVGGRLDAKAYGKKLKLRRVKRTIFEDVELPGGVHLTVSQSGCEHHGVVYEFRGVKDTKPVTNVGHYARGAIELLRTIKREKGRKPVMLEGLQKAAKAKTVGEGFSCSVDAWCELSVKRDDPKTVTIQATYSFPL